MPEKTLISSHQAIKISEFSPVPLYIRWGYVEWNGVMNLVNQCLISAKPFGEDPDNDKFVEEIHNYLIACDQQGVLNACIDYIDWYKKIENEPIR